MKKVYTAISNLPITEAVEELYNKINEDGAIDKGAIKLLIFFVSSNYDSISVNTLMNSKFSGIKMFGCTTAGEIHSGYMGSNNVVAMGLTGDIIEDVHWEIIEKIENELPDFEPTMHKFTDYYGENVAQMSNKKYFGLLLIDGMSGKEEEFLDTFGEFTNIRFTGGSPGDDFKFQGTIIYANGKCYEHSGLICILKVATGFSVERTQSFRSTGKKFIVTKADGHRIINELDGKPATEACCEALGINQEELFDRMIINPVGLILDTFDKPFIRSLDKILPDGSLNVHCSVVEGMELEILESTDMIAETKNFIEDLFYKYPNINGMLAFNCVLRYKESQLKNEVESFGKLFNDIPTVGFCTYGEYYIGLVNQTLTVLVF